MNAEKKIKTPGFWKEHLVACDGSGLTQRKYCEREGISFNNFVYQNGRLRRVQISGMPFIKTNLEMKSTSSQSGLQIILPNGIRIALDNDANTCLLQVVLGIVRSQ